MPDFKRIPGKFSYSGMDIHHPPDKLPPGRCSFLSNLQQDTQNETLELRPALDLLATTNSGKAIHSLIRMNDSVPEATHAFSRFAGSGPNLYAGSGAALAQIDSGFSGNPLAMVPYRPPQSPESWLYVYDSLRQQRYKTDNTKQNIGIAAPTAEPSAKRIQPLYTVLDNAGSGWSGGTSSGGVTTGPFTVARVPASTTVLEILYDSSSTGMACIAPTNSGANYTWMTAGSVCIIGAETVVLEQAFLSAYSTTVAAIAYDSGSTGLCTIVPAVPLPGLQRNMLVNLASGTYARVLSVTSGPDGSYSFRCDTGATTITATATLTAPPSFRAWTGSTHANGDAITGNALQFTYTPTVTGGAMQDITAKTLAIDLSAVGTRPLQNEDYMHVSLGFDQPLFVTEVHVMLDVDATTNDYAHNYYYYVVRQQDFQASLTGAGGITTLSAQASAVSNQIISQLTGSQSVDAGSPQPPYPIPEQISTSPPSPAQLQTGSLAWLEVMFKLSDLTRVGSDPSRTLANVKSIALYVFTSGGIVNMYFDGWWVGGGYGPDCNFNSYGPQAPPIQWRYRYRNSLTGAHSTVSPETRNGETLRRQGISISAPNSPDAQVDTVDFERRGGTNPDWHYVGSEPQGGGGTTTFTDNVTEAAAQIGEPLEVTSYQPWPVTDLPHTGAATVTGTSVVWASGDKFNLRWLRGTEIIIGGNTYSLYAPPTSTTELQLAQNVPPPSGTYAFQIPEATIEGQPLYAAWLDEANNRICAVGDPLNPGLMYFSNADNPDGASDSNYIEITSPSEPTMNGFYAEGSNYVFTASSLYRVESTPGAANPYTAYRLSGIDGLAGNWAFDYQRRMLFYWGPDGVYAYGFGAAADNLTAQDLYPLFPHAGQQGQQGIPGVPVSVVGNVLYPPNYQSTGLLRIAYSESFVYATYQNSNTAINALVYSLTSKGWRFDVYTPGITLFQLEHGVINPLLMAAGSDGNLYQMSATGIKDAGITDIPYAVLTPAMDAGDSRASKQFGDLMLDYATGINTEEPGLLVLWDDLLVNGPNPGIPLSLNRTQLIANLVSAPDLDDSPLIHRNIVIYISGKGPVYLYEWQPSFLPLPEVTTSRVTDWQTGGTNHYKFFQGIRIRANTFGQAKVLLVEFDGYQEGPGITINSNGEQIQTFSFAQPFKARMARLAPDTVPWHEMECEWIYEIEPEPANYWISQPTALGQSGYMHAREIWLPFACSTAGAVISAIIDGVLYPVAILSATPTTAAAAGNIPTPSVPFPAPVKQYFVCPPLKGRYWQLTASGTGLQIYEKDVEFLVKSWGSTGAYQRVRPFGDVSGGGGTSGARV
jgi:hypothetical protein